MNANTSGSGQAQVIQSSLFDEQYNDEGINQQRSTTQAVSGG